MGIQNLPLEERDLLLKEEDLLLKEEARINWVIDWITRMARKYGGVVYEKDGNRWDWGQALCREVYGKNWESLVPESPPLEDIEIAKGWESGQIPVPEWVDQERFKKWE